MMRSETTAKLDTALAKAQGEFTNPAKNRQVEVFKDGRKLYSFDYATFDSILAMARPVLAKHDISVTQAPSVETTVGQDNRKITIVTVETVIAHAGEWRSCTLSGPAESWDMQKVGAAMTYLMRYSYCAMLNIASEFDDDGNAASGHEAIPTERQREQMPACPQCGKSESVIKGREEYGGGFVCYQRKDGCGHKWHPESAHSEPAPKKDKKATKPAEKKPVGDSYPQGKAPDTAANAASKLPVIEQAYAEAKDLARCAALKTRCEEIFNAGEFSQEEFNIAMGYDAAARIRLAPKTESSVGEIDEFFAQSLHKDDAAALLQFTNEMSSRGTMRAINALLNEWKKKSDNEAFHAALEKIAVDRAEEIEAAQKN